MTSTCVPHVVETWGCQSPQRRRPKTGMSIGAFTDREVRPTAKDIETTLGMALQNWSSLLMNLRQDSVIQEELKYCYGRKYGWARQLRRKGKLLLSLYPNRDNFVVQVILNRAELAQAAQLKLHAGALQAIESATEYSEGKWLFIPVNSAHDVSDVLELVAIKSQRHE